MQEEQEAETIHRKRRRRSRAEFAKDAAAETRTSRLTPFSKRKTADCRNTSRRRQGRPPKRGRGKAGATAMKPIVIQLEDSAQRRVRARCKENLAERTRGLQITRKLARNMATLNRRATRCHAYNVFGVIA